MESCAASTCRMYNVTQSRTQNAKSKHKVLITHYGQGVNAFEIMVHLCLNAAIVAGKCPIPECY